MFALRGLTVSLSLIFLLYVSLSFAVELGWRLLFRFCRSFSARGQADALLALRLLPLLLALGVTLAFAVPSFLILEPRDVEEPIGIAALLLSLGAVVLLVAGVWKVTAALMRVSQLIARWSKSAALIAKPTLNSLHGIPVMRVAVAAPPLTASGILRAGIWVSNAAEFVLTGRELAIALNHELVHVQRRDNLKKLLLTVVSFPGMRGLDRAWCQATELAADDLAVSSATEALDLAAAVIKLSRLQPTFAPARLTASLVHGSADSVSARVERLIAWSAKSERKRHHRNASAGLALLGTAALTAIFAYSPLLLALHSATEWLVR